MSVAPGKSVWDDENDNVSNTQKSSTQSIWKPFLLGLLISLTTGSIVIAVIITLWILVKYTNLWYSKDPIYKYSIIYRWN